jgi:hypothetical protein
MVGSFIINMCNKALFIIQIYKHDQPSGFEIITDDIISGRKYQKY